MSGAFSVTPRHALTHVQHGSKAAPSTSASRAPSTSQASSTSSHDEASHAAAHDTQTPASKHPSAQSANASQGSQASQSGQASHDTGQAAKSSDKSGDKDKQAKAKQEKAFTAVFDSLLQEGKANAGDTKAAGSVLTASAKADPKAKKGDTKSDASDGNQAGNANVALAGLPMFAADKGKGLPQLTWSGYVAVADNKGAKAVAMQGDQNNVVGTQTISAKDLPNAVLKAQEQLAHAQLQQGGQTTPTNNAGHFTAALNKAHLPGLHMTHQFLADTASLSQTQQAATATSNVHNVLAHELSGVAATATATSARGDNATQQINVPVQQPQWGQQLGDRVQWLLGQNLHQAAIHLNPPELGSLDVHIQMHGDQANVNFSSPHAVVRHAVDAAMPRLREMLGETGLILGDVNVSGQALAQHHSHNPQNQRGQERQVAAIGAVEEPHATTTTSAIRHLRANGMLDVYA